MKILQKIGDLFGGNFIGGITDAVDRFVTTKEEKERLKQELLTIYLNQQAEMSRLQLEEIDSARNREIQLKNSIGVWVQNIAASVIITAFVVLLFVIVKYPVEVNNKELVYTLLGVLGTLVTTVFNYWFGSSLGSANKEKSISELVSKAQDYQKTVG